MASQWQWDPTRQEHYMCIPLEDGGVCAQYQSGYRQYYSPQAQQLQPVQPQAGQPVYSQSQYAQPQYVNPPATAVPLGYGHSVASQQHAPNQSTSSASGLAEHLGALSVSPNDGREGQNVRSSAVQGSTRDSSRRSSAPRQPLETFLPTVVEGEDITDHGLAQQGVRARSLVRASSNDPGRLDDRYRKQRNGFYVVGKVFKILWPEPAGNSNTGASIVPGKFDEKIGHMIRWFVVVRGGNNYCTCLTIHTYRKLGVAKKSVNKNEHAIIYTTNTAPRPKPSELPRAGEGGMLRSIRINRSPHTEHLHPMSRINFGRVYTVEHNVKVFDYGDVTSDHLHLLVTQFHLVMLATQQEALRAPISQSAQPGQLQAGTAQAESSAVGAARYTRMQPVTTIQEDQEDDDDEESEDEDEDEDDEDEDDEDEDDARGKGKGKAIAKNEEEDDDSEGEDDDEDEDEDGEDEDEDEDG